MKHIYLKQSEYDIWKFKWFEIARQHHNSTQGELFSKYLSLGWELVPKKYHYAWEISSKIEYINNSWDKDIPYKTFILSVTIIWLTLTIELGKSPEYPFEEYMKESE
jgi:hypothetical protein